MIDPRQVPLSPVGTHPYAMMGSTRDQSGQLWLVFYCRACGDLSQKPCTSPQRMTQHGLRYAMLHSHGLKPVR